MIIKSVKKIKFQNETYWLTDSVFCQGIISPLNHFNEKGKLLVDPGEPSYAIIENNEVRRFREKIGDASEIEYLDEKEPVKQEESIKMNRLNIILTIIQLSELFANYDIPKTKETIISLKVLISLLEDFIKEPKNFNVEIAAIRIDELINEHNTNTNPNNSI